MADSSTFKELGLDQELLDGLVELGFETPTPVQQAVIPRLLESDRDFVGLAQTGTGKTAAFGLPLLQQIKINSTKTQALILCPTRELCLQIARDLKALGKCKKKVRTLAVYGGTPIDKQIMALDRGVQIIVATPGRMNDLLRRKRAKLENVRKVVLDEADEMLNMGFKEDLETILEQVPDSAQTLLFSATMPKEVAAIAGNYMKDPEEVTIGTRNAGADNVTHVCYTVHAKDRYLALKRIADLYPNMYGIVFCRTRIETQEIADRLMQDGYNADSLHGDLTQAQRDRVMERLRSRSLNMLVATDVAARGIDVNDLTHIINYNLPDDLESYTHRSGRTGRAGKDGMSVVIVHMREKGRIRRIESLINKKFEFREVPSGQEVCEAQLLGLIQRVKDVDVDHAHIDKYLPEIEEMLAGMSREDVIKHFVSLEFNRFLKYYRKAPDLNAAVNKPGGGQGGSRSGGVSEGFTKLFVNLGRKDHLHPKHVMGLVNDAVPGGRVELGRIVILDSYSFVEIRSEDAQRVVEGLNDSEYSGRSVRVEPVDPSKKGTSSQQRSRRFPPRHGGGGRPRSGPVPAKRKFAKHNKPTPSKGKPPRKIPVVDK